MKIENSVFLRPAKDPDPKSSPNGSRLKSPWVVVEVVVFEVPTAESTGREEIEARVEVVGLPGIVEGVCDCTVVDKSRPFGHVCEGGRRCRKECRESGDRGSSN